jgi:hypothetical protein
MRTHGQMMAMMGGGMMGGGPAARQPDEFQVKGRKRGRTPAAPAYVRRIQAGTAGRVAPRADRPLIALHSSAHRRHA